ncbi:hypothetical protein DFW101_3493 [Solidesulfovibrio carbinoliphilus subsp. oakridgensis]|uniref:Uncharacterized protein n=1 Tax=Solidesulfovibrio carbinoliphilus subsp. oakridgensis TaxID=694327 RepID=G7QC43_9BACT|nr:hypothetical protein [Solidesulfovibrio carbinoliphilus]EHJ49489.1 hypothetical protein DFW101_3493 [Solidesulfovibrio carbinoliphilus subsp. oakridgensis]
MFGIGIVELSIVFGVLLLIFLLLREFNCWYFKINEHIQDQWKQLVVLRKILAILEKQEARASQEAPTVAEPTEETAKAEPGR